MTEGFSAEELRTQVEAVNASRGTIVAFDFVPAPNRDYPDVVPTPLTYVAISNGESWGITNPVGGGDHLARTVTHGDFVKLLARKEVVSATTLVAGEAFKP